MLCDLQKFCNLGLTGGVKMNMFNFSPTSEGKVLKRNILSGGGYSSHSGTERGVLHIISKKKTEEKWV